MNTFEKLSALNVNEHTDHKNGLTYLSWAWAWAEFKKVYPNATYEIWRDEWGRPYVYDELLGYMVFTKVKVDDLEHSMWLPVMDGANNAMKGEQYSYKTKWGKEVTVKAATMFDINTAIMRCLTKNLAMFGLGLYIYAGEDLPEEQGDALASDIEKKTFLQRCSNDGEDYKAIARQAGAKSLGTMTKEQMGKALVILGEIEESRA